MKNIIKKVFDGINRTVTRKFAHIAIGSAAFLCACGLYSGTAWAKQFTSSLYDHENGGTFSESSVPYKETTINWNVSPGDTIVISQYIGKGRVRFGLTNSANLNIAATQEGNRYYTLYWRATIPSNYRGGTIALYLGKYYGGSDSEGRYWYGNECYKFILSDTHTTHTWSGWNTSGDNHYRYCTVCGSWLTSHNRWSSWKWITNASQHYRYCNNCGQTWDWGGHSFGSYYGNTATCTSGGVQYRSCSSCGYVETSNTGALGHSWPANYSQDGGYLYKNCTRCGERLETKGISYTIAFNGNGGSGTIPSMNFTYGVAQNLTKNIFTRENYDFLGWSTNKDDSTPTYIDEQAVTNLTTNHGSTVTLYAIWKLSTTTITFHDEGGTGGPGEQTWLIGSEQYPTSPIREGYNFAGWNTKEDGTGDMWPADNIVIAGASDYYAQWEPNTYTAVQESNSSLKQ